VGHGRGLLKSVQSHHGIGPARQLPVSGPRGDVFSEQQIGRIAVKRERIRGEWFAQNNEPPEPVLDSGDLLFH